MKRAADYIQCFPLFSQHIAKYIKQILGRQICVHPQRLPSQIIAVIVIFYIYFSSKSVSTECSHPRLERVQRQRFPLTNQAIYSGNTPGLWTCHDYVLFTV